MTYTDIQKATACELVKQNAGVIDEILLATIRLTLDEPKLPKMTIWRWWKHYQTLTTKKPENSDVTEKNTENVIDVTQVTLADKLELAAHKFIDHASRDELLMWTSSKDAMVAAGIAIEKMRLLRGLPTDIVEVLPSLVAEIRRKGYDPVDALRKMEVQFAALPDAPLITSTHGVN